CLFSFKMAGQDSDTQLIQAKLEKLGLDQTPEEFVAGLARPIRQRVEALQGLQAKHDELEAQFRKERAELEAKYEKLYAPLYVERSEIVQGTKEVPAKEDEPAGDGDENVKGIPEFWLTVLLKCDVTMDMIKDKDMDVLKYLRDIQAESLVIDGVSHGFKLRFFFDANPYFTNEVLEKTYHMLADDDGVLERAEGTKIEWQQGKDVTVKIMKKKKKGKSSAPPQVKTERVDSFFNFFDPPQVPDGDEDIDEDTMEELQAIIEADYEVGATIREKLIPEAVSWYTGEAMDEDELFLPGEDDSEDEDFEGEEGEEEGEESEEGAAPGAGGEGQAAGGQQQQPPECKQQ
ncbi:hypothetical protein Agub_g3857, partial [Astrephomene gubernaculifera]